MVRWGGTFYVLWWGLSPVVSLSLRAVHLPPCPQQVRLWLESPSWRHQKQGVGEVCLKRHDFSLNLTKTGGGAPSLGAPWSFSLSHLSTRSHRQFIDRRSGFPMALVPCGFRLQSGQVLSPQPLSLPSQGQQLDLWPQFSYGSRKSCCLFSSVFYLLLGWNWSEGF